MKVVHLSCHTDHGGAAKAAYRIHKSLLQQGVSSELWSLYGESVSDDIILPFGQAQRFFFKAKTYISNKILKIIGPKSYTDKSLALFGSPIVKMINDSDCDIVNLHWVQGDMLSVRDLSKIKKKIVWTLHDMWAFSGVLHYPKCQKHMPIFENNDSMLIKFVEFYMKKLKRRYYKKKMVIVTPSTWLFHAASSSNIFSNSKVVQIKYPLDLTFWKPQDREGSRRALGLPHDKKIILFGAVGGVDDPRKGYDLALQAIERLSDGKQYHVVVFGQSTDIKIYSPNCGITVIGSINDPTVLRHLYNSADVFALPSRIDNLPLTAIEAMSCGTPVVAFDCFGPPTIVKHLETGYLAKPYNSDDFSAGLRWILDDRNLTKTSKKCVSFAKENFDSQFIASQYLSLYREFGNI